MSDSEISHSVAAAAEVISVAEFLESVPPNRLTRVGDLIRPQGGINYLATPGIQLHCNSDACNGVRFFKCMDSAVLLPHRVHDQFLTYHCRNCQSRYKKFAIMVYFTDNEDDRKLLKLGEWPPFGPATPPRLIKLIGPDRELFLIGRRAENQGMGIGAYAYYRRVVESQKDRILEEITKVAEKLGAHEELISQLQAAQAETQFGKAIKSIKRGIPQMLLIDGHNPLALLHAALSEDVHIHTDAECLELATSIRLVLTELAERLDQALKDEAELKAAITRLLNRQ